MSNSFIARRRDNDNAVQTIFEHLCGTAKRAQTFADDFNCGQLAHDITFMHDIGKYSAEFQERINGANITVDHSTPGGKLAWQENQNAVGMVAAYCIMGHHGGLPDGGNAFDDSSTATLHGRLKKHINDCSAYKNELSLPQLQPPNVPLIDGFGAAFLIRMIFSTLIDADSLDSEAFSENDKPRGGISSIAELEYKFFAHISKFLNPDNTISDLNARRTSLLKNCLSSAKKRDGLFTLTAPTGSGKTIASMAFALKHAVTHNKSRIIYVVPYNTIIEQNAKVFEDVLGAENILQHHSNTRYNDTNEEELRKSLAIENWDYPIIITSSVQFFDSLFGNSRSSCRKLHNISNSVIIFDEAQIIPVPYLTPCVRAISELVKNYFCTAVLTTATQSALEDYFDELPRPIEITENPQSLYDFLRRANINSLEPLSDKALIERLISHNQFLCIVNTRKMAQTLFNIMNEIKIENIFHLSTLMYPKHRSQVLNEIRGRLANGQACKVVSTSLVEAGVDLDFPVVYREEAGVDSIIQAAGRCNREGKRPTDESYVYVFRSTDHKSPRSLSLNISMMHKTARNHTDIAKLKAIREYFNLLYCNKGNEALDIKNVVPRLNDGASSFSFPFKQIATDFQLIEEDTVTVYILSEKPKLERRLRDGERSRELFRELGAYSVSLYRSILRGLLEVGAVEKLDKMEDGVLLLLANYYDENCGVKLSHESGYGYIL